MKYDLIIIGGGPAGYICSIRASQLGFKVALIEKNKLGGTCLNEGCIPSKALLDSSHHYFNMLNNFNNNGIEISNYKLNFSNMMIRKDKIVNNTVNGIKYLINKNKIDFFEGEAKFVTNNKIVVNSIKLQDVYLESKNFIIATGSTFSEPAFAKIDSNRILSSTDILNLKEVPKKLLIIGAGVIGIELGSVYSRLGSNVDIIEYADKILPFMDNEISKEVNRFLSKEGINFHLSNRVKSIVNRGDYVELLSINNNGDELILQGDYSLISVGRQPYTYGLGLHDIGVELDSKGFINVDNNFRTNIDNIYAIGDTVKTGPMLAHKAEEEGVYVAEFLAGQKPHINYNLIPSVVYTWPEVASVGITEAYAIENEIDVKIGKFPFKALGRSRASDDLDGFIKVISLKETDEIVGVHIVGARASDLILQAVISMEFRASSEDISRICNPHPTFSEAFKEACLATDNRAIHI